MDASTTEVIEVPAMAGDPAHESAAGPRVITTALAAAGWRPPVSTVDVPPFAGSPRDASGTVNRLVAAAVRSTVRAGRQPMVLAGSCDVAPGVVAGLAEPGCGVVWIDAHADFNTPESSESGFWPGMTLAAVVGDFDHDLWWRLRSRPIAPERVALFGVRSLSPAAEAYRLSRSAMLVVRWADGVPQGPVHGAIATLASRVRQVYVHLDVDALDPTVGRGTVDTPVPGGLSPSQVTGLIDAVRQRLAVAAATIATYTPARDDGATLPAVVSAVRHLVGVTGD